MRLYLDDSLWIAEFLQSDSKRLAIDSLDIEVVNNAKRIDFPLFEKSNIAVHPELKFKRRSIGIPTIAITVGKIGNIGVSA